MAQRQRAAEEGGRQAALAQAVAEAENRKATEAEEQRLATRRVEEDRKTRNAERQRLAALQAEEDRKTRDAERQRLAALQAEENRRTRDAERQRLAALQAEEDRKAREAERQRLVALQAAEEDRKAREAERQRLSALKPAEPSKPQADPKGHAARCAPQARITWKRTPGWGALAVGTANCGFSWGLPNKVRAEWRALDICRSKSTDCKIVEYNQ